MVNTAQDTYTKLSISKRDGYERISKREWYARGGFSNSRCVRVERGGRWQYWFRLD